jgi:6-phosphogluconolactonase
MGYDQSGSVNLDPHGPPPSQEQMTGSVRPRAARAETSSSGFIALLLAGCAGCGGPGDTVSDASAPPRMDGSMSSMDTGEPDDAASTSADAAPGPEPSDAGVDVAARAGDGGSMRLVAYTGGYSSMITWFSVDVATGALSLSGSIAALGASPSFLAHNEAMTNLYAVDENSTGRVGAYAIDPATGALAFLDAVSSGGNGPAFLSVDGTGKFVLVANYGDGTVAVLPVGTGGRVGAASDKQTAGAEAHMIVADPSNHFVFVPCKGADYVAQFVFDAVAGTLTPNAAAHVSTAAGAGPRHLAFHPNGRFAYLINETNSTMTPYALDSAAGTLTAIEAPHSTVPASFAGTNTAAEVWVHPSGRWVLGSNRGDDSIVVFSIAPSTGKMTLVGFTKVGGQTPRDFSFDPAGNWLYAADQDSGLVVPFRFDVDQGSLSPLGGAASVPMVSYVGLGALQ